MARWGTTTSKSQGSGVGVQYLHALNGTHGTMNRTPLYMYLIYYVFYILYIYIYLYICHILYSIYSIFHYILSLEAFAPGLLDAVPHWQGPVDGLVRVAVTTSRKSKP